MSRVEGIVDRAETAFTGLDAIRHRADDALDLARATLGAADAAVAAATRTQGAADEAINAVGKATSRAGDALARGEGLLVRLDPVVESYEKPLVALAPSVRRLAETLEPHEVEALVALIDRLPVVVKHLDEDVLPVLASLDNVAPDVHDLLDTVQDLRQIVKGFPGSRLFRRRGAEEIAQEEEAEDDEAEVGS